MFYNTLDGDDQNYVLIETLWNVNEVWMCM